MISNMIDTGGASSVVYDSGVLTAAVTSVAIPDSATSGLTALMVYMEIPDAPSTNVIRLFVNNDTTLSNYGFTQLGTTGSTPYGTGTNAGSEIMHVNVQTGSNEHGMCTAFVRVVGEQMWWTSTAITPNNATTRQLDYYGGFKHTGTVTDLSGMSLSSSVASGIAIGSRIRLMSFS
jgi:hypothetical protein